MFMYFTCTFQELVHMHKPDTMLDSLVMEKKLYEIALIEWNNMEPIGFSFSPQMQKDVGSSVHNEPCSMKMGLNACTLSNVPF